MSSLFKETGVYPGVQPDVPTEFKRAGTQSRGYQACKMFNKVTDFRGEGTFWRLIQPKNTSSSCFSRTYITSPRGPKLIAPSARTAFSSQQRAFNFQCEIFNSTKAGNTAPA